MWNGAVPNHRAELIAMTTGHLRQAVPAAVLRPGAQPPTAPLPESLYRQLGCLPRQDIVVEADRSGKAVQGSSGEPMARQPEIDAFNAVLAIPAADHVEPASSGT